MFCVVQDERFTLTSSRSADEQSWPGFWFGKGERRKKEEEKTGVTAETKLCVVVCLPQPPPRAFAPRRGKGGSKQGGEPSVGRRSIVLKPAEPAFLQLSSVIGLWMEWASLVCACVRCAPPAKQWKEELKRTADGRRSGDGLTWQCS